MVSVSYTHLDVYKRQALNNPVGYLGLLSGEMGTGGIPLNERPDRYFHSPDVYKRQDQRF